MTNKPVRTRYRSTRVAPVGVWITFAAPSTGSAKGLLPANEIVEVTESKPGIDWVFARPEHYRELERSLVPEDDRAAPAYSGYALQIERKQIETGFVLVPGEKGEHPISDILDHGIAVFSPPADDMIRQLSRLLPRYRLWEMFDWYHAPGNDDLEDLLRYQLDSIRSSR